MPDNGKQADFFPDLRALALDLESVLIPEIWMEVARVTGIASLTQTTRDVSYYA